MIDVFTTNYSFSLKRYTYNTETYVMSSLIKDQIVTVFQSDKMFVLVLCE
jgi:hypothetical protein